MSESNFAGDQKVGQSILTPLELRLKNWMVPKIPESIETWHLTFTTIFQHSVGMGNFSDDCSAVPDRSCRRRSWPEAKYRPYKMGLLYGSLSRLHILVLPGGSGLSVRTASYRSLVHDVGGYSWRLHGQ